MSHKFIATDQFGSTIFIKKHPRKELMEHWGSSHADKMYIDDKEGNSKHIGYIVRDHWYEVLKISSMKGD